MTDLGSQRISFASWIRRTCRLCTKSRRNGLFLSARRIFTENDPGDGVYVIRDGLVEIAHLIGERALCVFSKFGPGEIFGEMAVIEDLPRSATTTAVKETHVYFIPKEEMGVRCSSGCLRCRLDCCRKSASACVILTSIISGN